MSATEQDSEITPVITTGRIGGTGGIRRRAQRGLHKRPWPLCRGEICNVVRSRVGSGRADGASDNRSGLKPSLLIVSLFHLGVFLSKSQDHRAHSGVCRNGRQSPSHRSCEREVFGACPEVDAGRSLHRARLEGAQPEGRCVWESVQSRSTRTSGGDTTLHGHAAEDL